MDNRANNRLWKTVAIIIRDVSDGPQCSLNPRRMMNPTTVTELEPPFIRHEVMTHEDIDDPLV